MRVEYLLPLPDTHDAAEHNFDTFLDEALKFVAARPVFTPQQLHQHLLERFPISEQPDDFWRCLASIRRAVGHIAEVRGRSAEWIVQNDGGYQDKLHSFDMVEPSGTNFAEQDCLSQYVKAELAALFADRTEITERELLFYLKGWQAFGDEAEQVLWFLTDDAFLVATESGAYVLGPGPEAPPTGPAPAAAPVAPQVVDIEGVRFVVSALRAAPTPPRVAAKHAEVSPPVPDEPFSIEDRSRAMVILNRLAWQNARTDGVRVSTLVQVTDDGRATPRERRSVIGRLWRRGYLLRNTGNPNDSIMRLRPDLPEDRDTWPTVVAQIVHELSLPYQPPTPEPKTGSQ